jgi:hypothetical protein
MFCPKCGSNQGDGKKFCTVCGTNLLVVSQALTGQLSQPPISYTAPAPSPLEIERQQQVERQSEMKSGIVMAVLGGGYLLYKIISFIFLLPFYGWHSPFGFLGFVAFILFAIGISKIFSSRAATASAQPSLPPAHRAPVTAPQPVFSIPTMESAAPRTNELEPVRRPASSVTEEDTKHLAR